MTLSPKSVLDASALLAWSLGEPGAARVTDALRNRAAVSAVNWTEFLTKAAEAGDAPETVAAELRKSGVLGRLLQVVVFDQTLSEEAARLRAATRRAGLSLGDRACLALGRVLGLPVLTADRAWTGLQVGVTVERIR